MTREVTMTADALEIVANKERPVCSSFLNKFALFKSDKFFGIIQLHGIDGRCPC